MQAFITSIVLTSNGDIFRLVLIIIVFVCMLFAAYYTTRFVGRVGMRNYTNSNMQIIEAMMVGPQKTLQIVKVGERYLLLAVTKEHVTYVTEIDQSEINLEHTNKNMEPFKNIFNDIIKRNK